MAQTLSKASKPLTKRGRFWKTHVEQWQASNLTQVQYCKDQGISLCAFRWWRRRLARPGEIQPPKRRGDAPNPIIHFAEVPMPMLQEVALGYAYEITLPNQMQLRVTKHFEPETVSTLLVLLGQAC
jgi:hypothetical protein